jgi:hypothetical protein
VRLDQHAAGLLEFGVGHQFYVTFPARRRHSLIQQGVFPGVSWSTWERSHERRNMLATLCPCPSCSRHVRYTESQCPFCHSVLPHRTPPRMPDVSRLSRVARVAVGAALAAACAADPGPGPTTPGPEAPPDAGAVAPMYGVPVDTPPPQPDDPVEPAPDPEAAPTPAPGPNDPGAARPMYGLPPPPPK